jgi:ABC-type uncharacterized transport system involved in gliding motility auxiliary subunit
MSARQQNRTAFFTLLLLGIAFIAAVMASNTLLRGFRIDLTENQLYTLSPGTQSLLGGIAEPINLYFYFSDRETADIQFLRSYATRVREMLEEFQNAAGGQLHLQVIDPLPFSEEEDRAAQFGLRNLGAGSLGDSIYFGLAATNSVGDEAVIDVFEPSEETSLEYDLGRLIYSLANPDKNVVGLLTDLPMGGGFNPQTQQPTQPWAINQQARQLFDVRTLPSSLASVDEDIELLWIVHPTDLDEQTLYAIDQFVLRGGRALIFVDPLAEVAAAAGGGMPGMPPGMGGATSSTLEPLFAAWGLEFEPNRVVADSANALSVQAGGGSRPIRHIGLLGLEADGIAPDDVVTTGLSSINLGTAGALSTAEDAAIELVPLLTSSAESTTFDAQRFQFLPDPSELLNEFMPGGTRFVLAARLRGPLKTAYPGGRPQPAEAAEDSDEAAADEADADAAQAAPAQHLTDIENGNVIVVADVDILSDRLWVQIQRSLFGQQLATAFANNGDFVGNAIANLAGSADLIGLRSRATFARPFDTVEALQREADARFRATEQQLQAELAETERRLGELQAARDDTTSLLMSPEQQAELQRFQAEQVRIRRELRSVQRDLDSSIEGLGVTLKVVNIAAVPLALTALALLMAYLRHRRRRGA